MVTHTCRPRPGYIPIPRLSWGGTRGRHKPAPEEMEPNLCPEQLVMGDPQASPSWNGWGNGPANTRFQPKAQGKLTAADLPRIQLKWAFGFSNAMTARPQPTVVGGRLFAPSENGHVYALNPRT